MQRTKISKNGVAVVIDQHVCRLYMCVCVRVCVRVCVCA